MWDSPPDPQKAVNRSLQLYPEVQPRLHMLAEHLQPSHHNNELLA